MTTMKRYEALHWASSFLEEKQLETKVAEILLLHQLKVSKIKFLTELNEMLSEEEQKAFIADLHQYAQGTPVQYITGVEQFYGRDFKVNEEVLIPRPETEELVYHLVERVKKKFGEEPIQAVDVGTGSGIIAITLALECPTMNMQAIDIAQASLDVAEENARRLGANVHFLQGDLLEPIISKGEKVDIVVSNPPYISKEDVEQLSPYVRDREPRRALEGGESGLIFYERFMKEIPLVLKDKGIIAFEIGAGQGPAVKQLLQSTYPQATVEVINDMNNRERIVIGQMDN